jgi:hypothetical protein
MKKIDPPMDMVEGTLYDAFEIVLAIETEDRAALTWRVLVCLSGLVAKLLIETFGPHNKHAIKMAVKEHDRLLADALKDFGLPPQVPLQ